MEKVLIAGGSGYLGRHLITSLKRQGYYIRAITRNIAKLKSHAQEIDDIFEGEITKPETLSGCCEGIDIVITTVGITRQKDGLSYMDVDYQANLNLLHEALRSSVQKFVYVSIFNAERIAHLEIVKAKQRFAEALANSGMPYLIIKPDGFFSDMLDFLHMATRGRVYLFGKGRFRMNPIGGQDLARICVHALKGGAREIAVGGPQVLTHTQIAETAFRALGKPVKITYIPLWIKKCLLFLLRTFTQVQTYGPIEFFMTILTMDMVAPACGNHTLEDFFKSSVKLEIVN